MAKVIASVRTITPIFLNVLFLLFFSFRPLVVRDSVRFVVTARARTAGNRIRLGVYADGENVLTLDEGQSVEIAKSSRTAKLIELEGYDPYDVLARKLGWSGSNVI